MSRKQFPTAVLLAVALFSTAWAEPWAPLLPLNEQGKQYLKASGKTEAQRVEEAPAKDAIDIPPYPGAYLAMAATSEGELISVQLASADAPEKVIDWYKQQLLDKGWRFVPELVTEAMDEVGVFVETTDPNVDVIDSLKYRQIRISRVNKPDDLGFAAMFSDVSSMKSSVAMQLKPMM